MINQDATGKSVSDVSPIDYRPQIDTLRAIAVGSVMFEHFLPWQFKQLGLINGVLVFFAISGFLITSILLKYRDTVNTGGASVRSAFATFYARRALRIFPAYYLLLAILFLAGAFATHGGFLFHLTYTSNIWTALNNEWDSITGHFWSLSVEEQFYLVWPLLLLMAPRGALAWMMCAGVVIGIGFRICAQAFDWGLAIVTLPMSSFDALFAGALLAYARHRKMDALLDILRKHGIWTLLAIPLLYVAPQGFRSIFEPTLLALMAAYIIDQCAIGYKGWLGWAFSRPLILYLGKISYGLYLYHYVIRYYVDAAWFEGLPFGQYIRALVWTVVTIIVAMASWHLFEKPLNGLKGRFKLRKREPVLAAGVSPT